MSGLSARQILGGFCLGFGFATYLFGTLAYLWLRSSFVIGVTNVAVVWVMVLFPALLMLLGFVGILKARGSR